MIRLTIFFLDFIAKNCPGDNIWNNACIIIVTFHFSALSHFTSVLCHISLQCFVTFHFSALSHFTSVLWSRFLENLCRDSVDRNAFNALLTTAVLQNRLDIILSAIKLTLSSNISTAKVCFYIISIAIIYFNTVGPLLSAPPLFAELDYPRFLRPKFGTPNLYEVQ